MKLLITGANDFVGCALLSRLLLVAQYHVKAALRREAEFLLSLLQVDSSRLRRSLNWRPPYTLRAGICKKVDWYNGDRKARM